MVETAYELFLMKVQTLSFACVEMEDRSNYRLSRNQLVELDGSIEFHFFGNHINQWKDLNNINLKEDEK